MTVKDYYKTLGVSPTATRQEIKKAFRMLAHVFHPDKNPGNPQSAVRFSEIQEAYEVLSDPQRREEYNYKRWYRRTIGKEYQQALLTPTTILAACQRLEDYVTNTNIFQVDFDALSYHIRQLMSDANVSILRQFDDRPLNARVIKAIIRSATPLPFNYIEPIVKLLLQVAGPDKEQVAAIRLFENERRRSNHWGKYRLAIILAATLALCWLIYAINR
jgi:molecular chaperone DnaJ